jgi:hypothetical protein
MDLTNKWMNDPTFLAQAAHFFGAVSLIMTAAHFAGNTGGFITGGVLMALAIVKEFWYDIVYEIPKQSFWDSALDFSFYFIGTLVASGILFFSK